MFQILVAVGTEEKHGYAIMRELDDLFAGPPLGPGTLYRSIKQLLDRGLLEERERPDSDDPRRRYYRVTEAGAAAAETETQHLEALLGRARETGLVGRPSGAPAPGTT
jgi:DNA-binding PadR family transcriptional regulator